MFKLFLLFILYIKVSSFIILFKQNNIKSINCINNKEGNSNTIHNIFLKYKMKPNDILNYITSIKDYTIITDTDNNKDLYDLMNNSANNVYYFNINNILDKESLLIYLQEKYKHINSGENLWIFYKGFILGDRSVIYNIINKKYNIK